MPRDFQQPSASLGGTPGRPRRHRTLMLALPWLASAAMASEPCAGHPTDADNPCARSSAPITRSMVDKETLLRVHRKLDQLAEDGYGRVIPPRRPAAPIAPAPAPAGEAERFVGRPRPSRNEREAKIRQSLAEADAHSQQKNQVSTARLTESLDRAARECGGQLPDLPIPGISDESFRLCTIFARTSLPYQIVVANDGALPLRLYLYESGSIQRVYTVGGVVTAIKP